MQQLDCLRKSIEINGLLGTRRIQGQSGTSSFLVQGTFVEGTEFRSGDGEGVVAISRQLHGGTYVSLFYDVERTTEIAGSNDNEESSSSFRST